MFKEGCVLMLFKNTQLAENTTNKNGDELDLTYENDAFKLVITKDKITETFNNGKKGV